MNGRHFSQPTFSVYGVVKDDLLNPRRSALLAQGGVISVQVLNEFANVARRKLQRSWPEVATALTAFRILCPGPLPITVATHEAALEIAERDGLSSTTPLSSPRRWNQVVPLCYPRICKTAA